MACLWHKDKFQQGHCNFRGNTDGWEVVSKAVEGEVVFYVTSIKAKIVCPIDQQLDTHKKTEILINGKVLNINLSLKLNTKILKNGAKKENYRRWGLWTGACRQRLNAHAAAYLSRWRVVGALHPDVDLSPRGAQGLSVPRWVPGAPLLGSPSTRGVPWIVWTAITQL